MEQNTETWKPVDGFPKNSRGSGTHLAPLKGSFALYSIVLFTSVSSSVSSSVNSSSSALATSLLM